MRADVFDAGIGTLFDKLCQMKTELGEPAFERAVRDLLQTLGVAAHREAERRAAILAAQGDTGAAASRVSRIGLRRIDDGIHEEHDT